MAVGTIPKDMKIVITVVALALAALIAIKVFGPSFVDDAQNFARASGQLNPEDPLFAEKLHNATHGAPDQAPARPAKADTDQTQEPVGAAPQAG